MRRPGGGYTILETLIVIAVSSAMFLTAVSAFGGRQEQVQFTQAVRDLESKLLDVINDVNTGFFEDPGEISCMNGATENDRPVLSVTGGSGQGSSEDCIFLGKTVHFDTTSAGSHRLNIASVVGLRSSGGEHVSSLALANPVVIAGGDLEENVSTYLLQWGLKITDTYQLSVPTIGGMGLFTSFSRNDGISSVDNSQSTRFASIPSTALTDSHAEFVSEANTITDGSPLSGEQLIDLSGTNVITICVQSATDDDNKRAALIIEGGTNATVTVDFDKYDEAICSS
jgi:type II secretory pathway pseudopilin PulG